jgi:hypothetical protein
MSLRELAGRGCKERAGTISAGQRGLRGSLSSRMAALSHDRRGLLHIIHLDALKKFFKIIRVDI